MAYIAVSGERNRKLNEYINKLDDPHKYRPH